MQAPAAGVPACQSLMSCDDPLQLASLDCASSLPAGASAAAGSSSSPCDPCDGGARLGCASIRVAADSSCHYRLADASASQRVEGTMAYAYSSERPEYCCLGHGWNSKFEAACRVILFSWCLERQPSARPGVQTSLVKLFDHV